MTSHLVSICIPTCDGASTLAATLETVVSQRSPASEVLIVDDQSSDDTLAVVERYASDLPDLRIEVNPARLGLARNWNRCVEIARGEWIKFVFQDDLLETDAVAQLLSAASADTDVVVCHRRPLYDNASRERRRQYRSYHRWSSLRRVVGRDARLDADAACALVNCFPYVNVYGEPIAQLLRRRAVLQVGGFDPAFIQAVDYELVSRLTVARGLTYVDRTLATFRVHGGATTVGNFTARRFMLETIEPALLAARHLSADAFAPLRRWAERHNVDLERRLDERLDVVAAVLAESASVEHQQEWDNILRSEAAIRRAWDRPRRPPASPAQPSLPSRGRAWSRLLVQESRRAAAGRR